MKANEVEVHVITCYVKNNTFLQNFFFHEAIYLISLFMNVIYVIFFSRGFFAHSFKLNTLTYLGQHPRSCKTALCIINKTLLTLSAPKACASNRKRRVHTR